MTEIILLGFICIYVWAMMLSPTITNYVDRISDDDQ